MRIVLFLVLFFFCLRINAQTTVLHGRVTDEQGKPVNFASVWIEKLNTGTLTNNQGLYRLNINHGDYRLSFRSPGFVSSTQRITAQDAQAVCDIKLLQVDGPGIVPGYADSIVRMVFARENLKEKVPHYSGVLYNKVIQRLDRTSSNFKERRGARTAF
jgi:hypothetical protein